MRQPWGRGGAVAPFNLGFGIPFRLGLGIPLGLGLGVPLGGGGEGDGVTWMILGRAWVCSRVSEFGNYIAG